MPRISRGHRACQIDNKASYVLIWIWYVLNCSTTKRPWILPRPGSCCGMSRKLPKLQDHVRGCCFIWGSRGTDWGHQPFSLLLPSHLSPHLSPLPPLPRLTRRTSLQRCMKAARSHANTRSFCPETRDAGETRLTHRSPEPRMVRGWAGAYFWGAPIVVVVLICL